MLIKSRAGEHLHERHTYLNMPQGYGRKELLNQLGFSINAEEQADWPLLKSGAGNPIGNLRIKEAYDWLQDHSPAVKPRGFSLSEIIERKIRFH